MHKPKNIKCNFCEKAFGLERDLRYHQTNRCKRKRLAESSSDTVTKKKKPKSDDEILRNLLAKLPPHLKIIDTSEMVTTSTQTDTVVHDAGLQVYIEQPYYNPSPDQQYSTQTEPMYTNQYQQTYTIPCPNYADWRHSETQTQNPTNTIGTATPYWHGNESGTQTWYPSDEPQMIDSYSMTDELNYMN
uniref:C2H2-type domain-containing protein n=1 Tax=Panagrolaimus sp. ES5 TaxID=591445 RepID=A0AC34FBQ9_9BILA